MRILIVSDLPQFVTGGAEKQAANLIEAWMDAGHQVNCFGRRMGKGPVTLGRHTVPVQRIGSIQNAGRALRGLSYGLSLAWLLLRYRHRFDVIYTRFLGEAAITVSFLKWLGWLRQPLVATPANTGGTGSDVRFLASLPYQKKIIALLDRHCEAINLIAPAMTAELQAIGFCGKNFSHVPNGVLLRPAPPAMTDRPHRFLAIGRLARQKGYDILIEALAQIREALTPGLIRIAGGGPERKRLQDLAQSLGVEQAITWLGELDHPAVLKELEKTQVFLLPSRYEGMSNAGLEAMERGLAMLMTRCGGLDTYVQPNSGWVVDTENSQLLAQAILHALQADPSVLAAMGSQNRQFVQQHFSLPAIAERYLALFEEKLKAAQETALS